MQKHYKKFIILSLIILVLPILPANAAINSLNGLTVNTQTFASNTSIQINSSGSIHTLNWKSGGLTPIANGGTNNSAFTAGSVIFASGSKLTQDNNNFFYASSSISFGIGTKTPGYRLDVQGGQINASGGLCIAGDCRTSWLQIASGSLNYLSKFSGQSSLVKSQLFDDGANVGIGTASPLFTLDVNGTVKATEVKTNTISATGSNQSISLNPTGTGKVMVGGDSIVVASKSSNPTNPKAGQIYFNTTSGKFRGYDGSAWVDFITTPESGVVSVLVVAGGGSGGAGGGGAGGYRYDTSHAVTAQAYAVTVGAGGTGVAKNIPGNNGNSSSFDTITATGGGGGGENGISGYSGGSGGGGGYSSSATTTGGSGTTGQGNAGGGNAGFITDPYSSGGGGGANEVGETAPDTATGGNGGNGITNSISGSPVTYAGGGGGAVANVSGPGGTGVAGSGGTGGGGAGGVSTSGTSGTANTGGGGGGVGNADVGTSGSGGSGIIIISYPTGSLTATGGTVTTSGGNTIHTFTSSGTFTVTAL